ncbi:MAG: helix-turn-helix domain-containing protein [Candidatus Eisenbacteria bacterium]|nr:helix-turn-helix domain-containing protein [Candidatus Eisenbacteria bacterium]
MPWSTPTDQKILFIADVQRGVLSIAELARRYGISGKTACKWIERFREEGPGGLEGRSRQPLTCPHDLQLVGIRESVFENRVHSTETHCGSRSGATQSNWDLPSSLAVS